MARQRSQTLEKHTFPADWTSEEIARWLAVWKKVRAAQDEFKQVVFVSGVFDLLHSEHREFLRKARAAGNFLVAALETDARVRQSKGPDRPIQSQEERRQAVEDTGYADIVEILPEAFSRPEHHIALMKLLRPAILAVSSHSPFQEGKRQIMELVGGKLVVVHEHNPEVSTTKMVSERRMEES